MEAIAMYLLKSVIWLTGFSVVYYLFLRNERFFVLNRLFLLSGILTSLLFPFISVHYTVVIPLNALSQADNTAYRIQSADINSISTTGLVLLVFISLRYDFHIHNQANEEQVRPQVNKRIRH